MDYAALNQVIEIRDNKNIHIIGSVFAELTELILSLPRYHSITQIKLK